MISYFFPPMGGVAVQRIVKFCKFLPEFGWQPIVLTVRNGYWTQYDFSNRDYETGFEVIYRTPFYSPFTILRRMTLGKANFGTTNEDKSKAFRKLSYSRRMVRILSLFWCVPDEFISWFPTAICHGLRIIRRHNIELLYANDAPHSSSLIALTLSKITGLPFISDFRDLWTGDPNFNPRNRLEEFIHFKLEKKVVEKAKRIITVSNGCAEDFTRSYRRNIVSKLEVISNGFDYDDFAETQLPDRFKTTSKFRIVYTGSFFGKFMSPENFFVAFSRFRRRFQIDSSDIELIFAGSNSTSLEQMAEELDLGKYVTVLQNLPHRTACSLQKSADLLLLIVYSEQGGENVLSAKLFEYLAAGPPILAIAPRGEVSDIIDRTEAGIVANPDDVNDIERCLMQLYVETYLEKQRINRNESEIQKFTRRKQTHRLADIFDEVVEN